MVGLQTYYELTSLLRRLQAQTLPNATQPIGKINPFSKIAVTLEPDLDSLQDFESPKNGNKVYFMTKSTIFNH